jgi:hypothetical protein
VVEGLDSSVVVWFGEETTETGRAVPRVVKGVLDDVGVVPGGIEVVPGGIEVVPGGAAVVPGDEVPSCAAARNWSNEIVTG